MPHKRVDPSLPCSLMSKLPAQNLPVRSWSFAVWWTPTSRPTLAGTQLLHCPPPPPLHPIGAGLKNSYTKTGSAGCSRGGEPNRIGTWPTCGKLRCPVRPQGSMSDSVLMLQKEGEGPRGSPMIWFLPRNLLKMAVTPKWGIQLKEGAQMLIWKD